MFCIAHWESAFLFNRRFIVVGPHILSWPRIAHGMKDRMDHPQSLMLNCGFWVGCSTIIVVETKFDPEFLFVWAPNHGILLRNSKFITNNWQVPQNHSSKPPKHERNRPRTPAINFIDASISPTGINHVKVQTNNIVSLRWSKTLIFNIIKSTNKKLSTTSKTLEDALKIILVETKISNHSYSRTSIDMQNDKGDSFHTIWADG